MKGICCWKINDPLGIFEYIQAVPSNDQFMKIIDFQHYLKMKKNMYSNAHLRGSKHQIKLWNTCVGSRLCHKHPYWMGLKLSLYNLLPLCSYLALFPSHLRCDQWVPGLDNWNLFCSFPSDHVYLRFEVPTGSTVWRKIPDRRVSVKSSSVHSKLFHYLFSALEQRQGKNKYYYSNRLWKRNTGIKLERK